MQIRQDTWSIDKLVLEKDRINLNPMWQRGAAWKAPRQVLLIDSILRGMDMPKIYLRALPGGGVYSHEAVDGQQRLRAIWEFHSGEIALTHPDALPTIEGHIVADLTFPELHRSLRDRFCTFEVSVAEILSASSDEISNLFSRLQMGVSLNPAELRNAIIGPMRHVIDLVATSHEFFLNSRIPGARYKRQDYAAHAFALAAYGDAKDMKAPDLKRMHEEFDHSKADRVLQCFTKVGDALNVLARVNELSGSRITQKWVFVDLCWLIMQHQDQGVVINPTKLAACYKNFEERRRAFNSKPEVLIRGRRKNPAQDRQLYEYITAFRTQGGLRANLITRNRTLRAFCPDIDVGN